MHETSPPSEVRSSKRRFGCLWLLMASCLLGLAWCHCTPLNQFSFDALEALRKDPAAVLYSIDPWPEVENEASGFHGYSIVGQITISSSSDRAVMADHLAEVTRGAWDKASCFDPRHAIRAHAARGTFDFLICFQCGQALVYHPNGRTELVLIKSQPDFFNAYLKAHNVSLPAR